MLSGEIATQMRGRSIDVEVFPLSFAEFLRFNALVGEIPVAPYSSRMAGVLRHAMQRYLEEGGFPDVQGDDFRIRVKTLQGYVDAVLYRDIIERHDVPSVQSLRYTLDYIKHNFAHKISTRAISGVLKGLGLSDSREYIADYLDWLEQAYPDSHGFACRAEDEPRQVLSRRHRACPRGDTKERCVPWMAS